MVGRAQQRKLVEVVHHHHGVEPRAFGGDLYGPTVNLASRIVSIAFEGSVVASADVHDALAESPALKWKGLRTRFLKGIGRTRLYVVRRSSDSDEGTLERAARLRSMLRDRVAEVLERPLESGA